MDENQRKWYLQSMGVQLWVARDAVEAEVVKVSKEVEQVSTAKTNNIPVNELGWDALQTQVAACQACELHKGRTQTVFGVGNQQADLLIIGEAPGAEEDRKGEPFVGRAGKLLNLMLEAIGLNRSEVYIANILKCRPPGNRDPQSEEVNCCTPFLTRQIHLLQPKLILAVGRIAAHNLLKTTSPLGRLRGKPYQYGEMGTPLIVTYHPAYLLRNPRDKSKAYHDLQMVVQHLSDSRA